MYSFLIEKPAARWLKRIPGAGGYGGKMHLPTTAKHQPAAFTGTLAGLRLLCDSTTWEKK